MPNTETISTKQRFNASNTERHIRAECKIRCPIIMALLSLNYRVSVVSKPSRTLRFRSHSFWASLHSFHETLWSTIPLDANVVGYEDVELICSMNGRRVGKT